MPMGASTIFGERNKGDYGWRKDFRDRVVATGSDVNMIGSARMGDMLDNDCEGHMGFTIERIHEEAKLVVPAMQPNLVVLLAGANNIYQLVDVEHADQHLEDLIRYILEVSPQATVILSTLLLSLLPPCVPLNDDVNKRYRQLYRKLEAENKPVVLAELHPDSGLPDRPEAGDIGGDGAHPTDEGYAKMAKIYSEAVMEADRRGFLREPVDNGIPADGNSEGEPRIGVPPRPERRRDLETESFLFNSIQKRGWCEPPEPAD
ncbi:SGNH hydrolase-type esterase domain-containing protein [Xylariaceae sp. FL0016]|nr:SGNH hydrolase-type esterase domain-containing protein [Xylariaceae sp. FL0016]